ncbi:hypothetical protein R0131_14285 [Clostridium sp. AL.422]|uniref:hypothetical protein n=1 Tax=Clostridium TaxID=1485 RepID=UPI00293DC161|nr:MULTISPECIES: hypothetical protein [unclassified Clostridium]MDV4151993.1 hypothetical protein [Clostridium sp. AL.422]
MGFLDECLKYALTEGAKALGGFIDTKLSGYKYNVNCPHCNTTLGVNETGIVTCERCNNHFAYKPNYKTVCRCSYCREYTIFKKTLLQNTFECENCKREIPISNNKMSPKYIIE